MITTINLLQSYAINKRYIRTNSKLTKKYLLILQKRILQS